jgi:hypothetical protein
MKFLTLVRDRKKLKQKRKMLEPQKERKKGKEKIRKKIRENEVLNRKRGMIWITCCRRSQTARRSQNGKDITHLIGL